MTKVDVAVVDYGLGNLLSVHRALEAVGARPRPARTPGDLAGAGHVVLPGVGNFADGVRNLVAADLVEPLREHAASGRPLLGICLGMQLMFEASEEGPGAGLGLVAGEVRAIPTACEDGEPRRVPLVGWAPLRRGPGPWSETAVRAFDDGEAAYFVHSFAAAPEDPACVVATIDHRGFEVVAAVSRGATLGCQFHPEKSGPAGLALLRRFLQA